MTLLELAAKLIEMAAERGDQPAFIGSLYQDAPIARVVWEDGYPLIVGEYQPEL